MRGSWGVALGPVCGCAGGHLEPSLQVKVKSQNNTEDTEKDKATECTRIPEQTCRRGVEWVNFRSVSRFDLSSSSREPFVRVPLHVGRVLACGRATVASPGPEFRTSLGAAA